MNTNQTHHPMLVDTGIKTFTIVHKTMETEDLQGCVEFSKALLSIDPTQSSEDYKLTLLHEICHIGLDLFGLGDDEEMPQFNNEYLTTVTSNMLQLLAALNKELFEFIFSSPK